MNDDQTPGPWQTWDAPWPSSERRRSAGPLARAKLWFGGLFRFVGSCPFLPLFWLRKLLVAGAGAAGGLWLWRRLSATARSGR